ncbi:hypothetical protein JCM10207_007122 [Rhodosporidiobolus poonsookiae]
MAASASTSLEPFGASLRQKYWRFEDGWNNLNHGSYGAAPAPVLDALAALRAQSERAPDRFMKTEYQPLLDALRARLASFVDCDTGDLVMVGNATMGINAVLRSLTTEWKEGDKLLYLSSTIYPACATTLQYIIDTHPHLSLSLLPVHVTYPLSHDALVSAVRAAIERAESAPGAGKVRLALVDAISSMPGVRVPWERLVELFRENGVLSLIDAAHQIGQLPVSLRTSRPDFWVSNCHKWLLAARSSAVLYVDKQHQHLMHSLPTAYLYRSPSFPTSSPTDWTSEFSWTGTVDWAPILSTAAALDFRETVLGGENRIREYCHALAKEGGEVVARVLGTEVMRNEREEDGELIANMVTVRLPLPPPSSLLPPCSSSGPTQSILQSGPLSSFWARTLLSEHKTHAFLFVHGDAFWVRLSATVYLEVEDFRRGAEAIGAVCEAIRRGEHERVEEAKEEVKAAEEA